MAARLHRCLGPAHDFGDSAADGTAEIVSWKEAIFRLLGKDPEPIVVSFLSGPEPLARGMLREVMELLPDREHWAITDLSIDGVRCIPPSEASRALSGKRIGLAPVLFTPGKQFRSLRWKAISHAPTKLLAYNSRLERHHLRLRTGIASLLFLRGTPLDRIWIRPAPLFPWKRDRTVSPDRHQVFEGRPGSGARPRIGVFSPYFPYPLSHGGAVRIYNLLREAARDFDLVLFSFSGDPTAAELNPILQLCWKVVVFPQPRYREPRWASILPPEVREFYSKYVAGVLEDCRRIWSLDLLQIEYTQLALYSGDILVEHDVTCDLFDQIAVRERTLSARRDALRWRRFEERAIRKFRNVVVMSAKDAGLLRTQTVKVIPNGVDLARFQPESERAGAHLLFVGSFRHFPNVVAYRFFVEEVWPVLAPRIPDLSLTVVAGPDFHLYWNEPPPDARIEVHGFISDVRPFYSAANLAVVPTQVSAGTNLKVLEAMAMERAVVSTSSGCAGLGLEHGRSIWVADTAPAFADGVELLLRDSALRAAIARNAREEVKRYDWRSLGAGQKRLWNELLDGNRGLIVRPARLADSTAIDLIQSASDGASHWEPNSYFDFDVQVAEKAGRVVGFLVSREVAEGEIEVLNLAVSSEYRRQGIATRLLRGLPESDIFLEVRESNSAAKALYSGLGFDVAGRRIEYYEDPVENALIMRRSVSTSKVV